MRNGNEGQVQLSLGNPTNIFEIDSHGRLFCISHPSTYSILFDFHGRSFELLLSHSLWVQASVVAERAAKSIADMQLSEESESLKEEEGKEKEKEKEKEEPAAEKESDDEDDKLRKSALDKLEKASEESFLGQASLACTCIFCSLNLLCFPIWICYCYCTFIFFCLYLYF